MAAFACFPSPELNKIFILFNHNTRHLKKQVLIPVVPPCFFPEFSFEPAACVLLPQADPGRAKRHAPGRLSAGDL